MSEFSRDRPFSAYDRIGLVFTVGMGRPLNLNQRPQHRSVFALGQRSAGKGDLCDGELGHETTLQRVSLGTRAS